MEETIGEDLSLFRFTYALSLIMNSNSDAHWNQTDASAFLLTCSKFNMVRHPVFVTFM